MTAGRDLRLYPEGHALGVEASAGSLEKMGEKSLPGQFRGSSFLYALRGEQPEPVAQLEGCPHIVGAQKNGFPHFVGQSAKKAHRLHLGGEVEEGGGLVEKDEGGVLRQCLGDHGFLPFSIAQGVYPAVFQGKNPYLFQGFFHPLPILLVLLPKESRVWAASQCHEVENPKVANLQSIRENHANEPAPFACREGGQGNVPYEDFPFQGRLEGRQGAKQGAFPPSVVPEKGGEHTLVESGVDAPCHHLFPIAYGEFP